MIILGINDMSQDSSACLLQDGEVIAAVSEERMLGIKHCGGFPALAITECLRIAMLNPGDVDLVAMGNTSATAPMRFATHVLSMNKMGHPVPDGLLSSMGHGAFYAYRTMATVTPFGVGDQLVSRALLTRRLGKMGVHAQVFFFDHRLSHAASAFHTSGFRQALVLSLDAYGDGRSGALFHGRGHCLEEFSSFPLGASMGEFYGAITALLGYRFGSDEGTTMALAAFGKPILKREFQKRVRIKGVALGGNLTRWGRFTARRLSSFAYHRPEDLAASAQALLEETAAQLVLNAIDQTGSSALCISGGVALNVKLNQRLMALPGIKEVHVFPGAGDEGTAVGAAFLLAGETGRLRPRRMRSAALGTMYTRSDVEAALSGGRYSIWEYDAEEVARAIAGGRLVGWFDGRMEFGPRALGRRSLLADPRSLEGPEKIRRDIKRRPAFQPFCPSLTRRYAQYLLTNGKQVDSPFMTMAFDTYGEEAKQVPSVVHVDGSCRPQIVALAENPRYFELLRRFGAITGKECLLNTSLNRSGEPIARSPSQALTLLAETGIDLLVLGDLMVSKR